MTEQEYSAAEMRNLLVRLFPYRKIVLSQFTFLSQEGIVQPTGTTTRRGRQCYRMEDVLSIACLFALKEKGIPIKHLTDVPRLVQLHAEEIFRDGQSSRLSGYCSRVSLLCPSDEVESIELSAFLASPEKRALFWSYDIGSLAVRLLGVAKEIEEETQQGTERHIVAA